MSPRLLVLAALWTLSACSPGSLLSSCSPARPLSLPADAVVTLEVPRVGGVVDRRELAPYWPAEASSFFADATPEVRKSAGIADDARLVLVVRDQRSIVGALAVDDARRFKGALAVLAEKHKLTLREAGDDVELVDAQGGVAVVVNVARDRAYFWLVPEDLPAAKLLLAQWSAATGAAPAPSSKDTLAIATVSGAWMQKVAERPLPATSLRIVMRVEPAGVVVVEGDVALTDEAKAFLAARVAAPSPVACAAADGAAVFARLPSFDDDDVPGGGINQAVPMLAAAEGQLVGPLSVALTAPPAGTRAVAPDLLSFASVVVVGTPKDAAAERALLDAIVAIGGAGTQGTVGGHVVRAFAARDAAPQHAVHAVVESGLFALSVGSDAALTTALAGTKPCDDAPFFLVIDGARTAPLVTRAIDAFSSPLLERMRAMAGDTTTLPGKELATQLAQLGRLELTVRPAPSGAHLVMRATPTTTKAP